MATISAAEVARLRKMTGAGMMDCKNALQEANGDFDKAIEVIRKKGQSVANKRADREAGEGLVLAKTNEDGTYGVITVLNCETDFVAKNEDFAKLANAILDKAVANKPTDLDTLKNIELDGVTIGEKIIEQIGIIGEKLDLSYFGFINSASVQHYIHPGSRLATLVGFTKSGQDAQIYKDIAMQVAAMNPVAVDKDNVPAEVVEKELEIGRELARREGKPDNLLERISQGKLAKYYKENTLLNQDFVKDNKQNIKQYLSSFDKELSVTEFKRFTLNS